MKKIFTLIAAAAFTLAASSQQVWDFSVLPTQTIDGTGNLATNIGTSGVEDYTSAWCQIYQKGGIKDEEQFTAKDGEIFEMTKGLKWGIMEADKMVSWYNATEAYGGCYLKANKAVDVTIPAKAGQIIEFIAATSKNTKKITSAGIDATVEIAQWGSDYAYTSYTCTVTEDNPTLSLENNICFQKIIVKKAPVLGIGWEAVNGDVPSFTAEGNPAAAFSKIDLTVEGAAEGRVFASNYKGGNTGVNMIAYNPAADKEPVTLTFAATIAEGVTFKPTKIGFNAARVGTDGGLVTAKFVVDGAETTLVEDMIPARNNKETADDAKKDEEKFNAGRFEAEVSGEAKASVSLILIGNGLNANKQYAFGDVQIIGTAEGASGISELKVVKAGGALYNLAGQKVGRDYKGIVIMNGKKVVNK